MELAVNIVNLCNETKGNSVLTNQLLRSGTSVGANIHEANYAHGKADFASKLKIALKEAYETEYWLTLFDKTGIISHEQATAIKSLCGSVRRVLIASLNTPFKAARLDNEIRSCRNECNSCAMKFIK